MLKLTSEIKVTKPYGGKSKFSFWHEIEIGDVLFIQEELKKYGKYIPYIKITNLRTKESFTDTRNSMCDYLLHLGFENLK